MSVVSDVVHADYAANPRVLRGPAESHGRVRFQRFEYEASGLAAGSTINIGTPIPKGARLLDLAVLTDDLGSSNGTIEVGDAGDTDRFLAAYATGAAAFKTMTKDGKIDNLHYEFPEDTQLQITTAGNSLTGTIKGHILFSE